MARRWTPSLRRGAISASACFRALAAGQAVGNDADMMAAVGLAVGEIEDVAEDAADGRAHRVQDAKRLTFNHRHGQNQRSPTSTVSPGLSGVPGGTTSAPCRMRRCG